MGRKHSAWTVLQVAESSPMAHGFEPPGTLFTISGRTCEIPLLNL